MLRLDALDERAYALNKEIQAQYDDLAANGIPKEVVTLARTVSMMTMAQRKEFDVTLELARAELEVRSELSIEMPDLRDDTQPERVAQEPQRTGAAGGGGRSL